MDALDGHEGNPGSPTGELASLANQVNAIELNVLTSFSENTGSSVPVHSTFVENQ